MEKESVIIAYDGEALKNHEIDAEELAFALTGFADLFKHAAQVVEETPRNRKVSVKVCSLQSGSFEIHLLTVCEDINRLIDWFATDKPSGLANLIALLGFGSGVIVGLIQFLKKKKNNPVTKILERDDDCVLVTYLENNEEKSIIVKKQVYALSNDANIHKDLEKILRPLTKEGVDVFEVRNKKKEVQQVISKEELPFFLTAPQSKVLNENISEMWLSFVSISFRDGYKWKFTNGETDFYATIEDKRFLGNVNSDTIRFGKNDKFRAKVKTVQLLTENDIKTVYEILEIMEYKTILQLRLDLDKVS